MVPEREARRLQTRLGRKESKAQNENIEDLSQEVRESGTVTIASTAEGFRNAKAKVEERDASDDLLEGIAGPFFKSEAEKIQSNMSKLAQLWNESDGSVSILDTERYQKIAQAAAEQAVRVQDHREAALTSFINEFQRGDTLLETQRNEVDVSDRNYYNIKSMRLNNVHGPSYHDPLVSNLTSMEMVVVEPHGLSLNEDLVKLAAKLGYDSVNPGRILYKVDVWFSGYNPQTGDWVWNIPVSDGESSRKPVVSYYVVLTGMEATFDVVGTEYALTFAPQGFMAIRPEEFSLEGTTIPTGENPTFGAFLKNLSEALRKKRRDETREALGGAGLNRIYKFYAPDAIMNAPFYQGAFLQRNNLTTEDPKNGMFMTIGKDVDILTLIRSALADLPEVQTAFLTDKKNSKFVDPVIHFTVRFNVKYVSQRPEIYDYDGIVYEFVIEPFLTDKKLGFDASSIQDYTSPESQKQRIGNMLKLGMIQRVYDYINTSENTDVLNFDIKLNRFYYESFRRSFDPAARKGPQTAATPSQVETASNFTSLNRELQVNLQLNQNPQVSKRYQEVEDSLLQKIFGRGKDHQDGDGKQEPNKPPQVVGNRILQGGLGTTGDPKSYGAKTSDGNLTKTKDEYLYRLNDHFALDLLTLESLELKGDPVWLLTPYASANNNPMLAVEAKDTDGTIVENLIQPHGEKVIYLNIKDTEQFDYMSGQPRSEKGKPNIMAGFYGIIGSENVFEGGVFTQRLNGYKMAHLNYAGEQMNIDEFSRVAGDSDEFNDNMLTSEWVTQVLDQASKLPQYSEALSEYRERQRAREKKAKEYK